MTRSRSRRSALLVMVAVVVLRLISLAPPARSSSDELLGLVNNLRSTLRLGALQIDPSLDAVAQSWSEHMAATGSLLHNPDYSTQVPKGWTKMGENIGIGPSIQQIFTALVASPAHYAYLTDPSYNLIGLGVAVDARQTVWITQDFEALVLAGRYTALTATRLLDTRTGAGAPLGPGRSLDLQVTGAGPVPATGVAAVALNITVTAPTQAGFLVVYPAGTPRPAAASLVFTAGQTISNLVVKVGTAGRITLYNSAGSSHVIADLVGMYSDGTTIPPPGGRFAPVFPTRVLDTATGAGGASGPVGPGQTVDVLVDGLGGLPSSGVSAVVLDVTVTAPTAAVYLTAYPSGTARPQTANLVYAPGQALTSLVKVPVGSGGRVSLYNSAGSAELAVDVVGWFTGASTNGGSYYTPLAPARILDTRTGNTAVTAGQPLTLQVSGQGGVPSSGVTAVTMNVTVTQPTGAGTLTVTPAGLGSPAPNLSFAAGQTVANLVVAWLGQGGRVSIAASTGSVHVVVDIAGWYS